MKKQLFLLLFIVSFLLSAGESSAARNIYITSDKSSLANEDELIITASPSGFTNGEKVYIKGAFFKEGSSNYFGLTKNNDSWIKNSITALSQREVGMGSWDNFLIVKPDYSDNGFLGTGDYRFKVGFYYLTSSGNTSSINWSVNEINIKINSAPSVEPTPAKTKSSASSTSSSSSNKSPTPTKQPTAGASKNSVVIIDKNNEESDKIPPRVRSASEYAQIKPVTNSESKKEIKVLGVKDKKSFAPILFLSGLVFLLAGLSSFIIKFLRERNIL